MTLAPTTPHWAKPDLGRKRSALPSNRRFASGKTGRSGAARLSRAIGLAAFSAIAGATFAQAPSSSSSTARDVLVADTIDICSSRILERTGFELALAEIGWKSAAVGQMTAPQKQRISKISFHPVVSAFRTSLNLKNPAMYFSNDDNVLRVARQADDPPNSLLVQLCAISLSSQATTLFTNRLSTHLADEIGFSADEFTLRWQSSPETGSLSSVVAEFSGLGNDTEKNGLLLVSYHSGATDD